MLKDAFIDVDAWIFDLDNTLYDPSHRLFDQIDRRMTAYIAEALTLDHEASNALRARYWREYGATLNGLMRAHDLDPEPYLAYVHDIDLDQVGPTPSLGRAIAALPGRKIVHTNGSRRHAERVLDRLAIADAFDAIFGIDDCSYAPKPERAAYAHVVATAEVTPTSAVMFEDTARNLAEPHAMGMRTVWMRTADVRAADGAEGDHVHFVADDLTRFLERLV